MKKTANQLDRFIGWQWIDRRKPSDLLMNVLVIDVGGTHVKILPPARRKSASSPRDQNSPPGPWFQWVKKLAAGWKYDAIAIGYPGPVRHGRPAAEPHNLAPGWVMFSIIYVDSNGR